MLPLFDSDNMTNMVVRGINVIKMNLVEMIIVCRIMNSSPYYSWILAEMCVNFNLLTIFFLLILNLTSESEIFCLPRSWRKFQRGEAAGSWLAVAPWSIYRDSVSLYLLKHRPGGIIFPMQSMQQAVGSWSPKCCRRLIGEVLQSRRRPY